MFDSHLCWGKKTSTLKLINNLHYADIKNMWQVLHKIRIGKPMR